MLTIEHFFSKFEIMQWKVSSIKKFLKLASNQSVKTACVCIFLFFHFFKYYGQNVFSRITVLYLIAKVERKNKLFNLKYEIILCQKEKRSKMVQLKVIRCQKNDCSIIHVSFFNLSKSVVLCVKEM